MSAGPATKPDGAAAARLALSGAASSGRTGPRPGRVGHYRWVICALLFFATTINYIDRQVLGILGPTLQRELHWNEQQFADVVSWFSIAYAIGLLVAGRIMDRLGTRRGFAGSVVAWSLAAMSTALARGAAGFSAARFALGLGEAGNFPAAIKTVAEWFPKRERALATGVFNAGTNAGAVVAPIIVPWITLAWGWRAAFIITGALGFAWVTAWLLMYRPPQEHPRCRPAELAFIRSDPDDAPRPVAWLRLLRHRQTWAFAIGKFLTDPIWWFYLYWLPKFLDTRYGIKLGQLAAPLIVIYLLADVGSVFGGWLSGAMIARGASVNVGRKTAMLVAALLIVPTAFAPAASSMWLAVVIVGVAAAAHQWWSANIFTMSSDMFPRAAVGSIVGIGGFAGAAGGVLFQRATGWVLQHNGSNYTPIFAVCGLAYVTALAVVHLLAPRLEPVGA
jgi:ACS family hexuronate transporter-like MFS transporter